MFKKNTRRSILMIPLLFAMSFFASRAMGANAFVQCPAATQGSMVGALGRVQVLSAQCTARGNLLCTFTGSKCMTGSTPDGKAISAKCDATTSTPVAITPQIQAMCNQPTVFPTNAYLTVPNSSWTCDPKNPQGSLAACESFRGNLQPIDVTNTCESYTSDTTYNIPFDDPSCGVDPNQTAATQKQEEGTSSTRSGD
jgi:hypothetical protein